MRLGKDFSRNPVNPHREIFTLILQGGRHTSILIKVRPENLCTFSVWHAIEDVYIFSGPHSN